MLKKLFKKHLHWLVVGLAIIFSSEYLIALKPDFFSPAFFGNIGPFTVSVIHGLGEITHELGFAFLVAVFVGLLIEEGHRVSITNILNTRIGAFMDNLKAENETARGDIKRDAFAAVFKKKLPNNYVDEVLNLALDIKFIRLNFELTYEFEELPASPASKEFSDYILLKCNLKYTSRNISNETAFVPLKLGLPNPQNKAMQKLVRVIDIKSGSSKFKTTSLSKADLDSGNNSLQDCFSKGESHGTFDASDYKLTSGSEMYYEVDYQLVKEGEDNEPFRTLHPSSNMKITVFDKTKGRNLHIDGEEIHRASFTSKPDGNGDSSVHKFELDRWLLPHQGIIIFWKNKQSE